MKTKYEILHTIYQRDNLLMQLGFVFDNIMGKWTHKMFPSSGFDFSTTDPDLFWTMDRIFKTCIDEGKRQKAEEVRNCLNIFM